MSDASQTIRSRALAITAVLAWVLAARVIWHAWIYYFENGARYRLESAAMAFLLVAGIVALLGHRSPHAIHHPQSLPWWWGVVFMSGAFVLYYQALFLGLLSDDFVLLEMTRSPALGISGGWFVRPAAILLWRLTDTLGESPVLLHGLNIVLHGLNAFLVSRLGCRLGLPVGGAVFAGTLFLTFPAAPEAVAWAAGSQDVLMTTAALTTVLAAERYLRIGRGLWLTIASFILGLLTKETAICVPLLVALCCINWRQRRDPRTLRLVAALAIVALAYLAAHLSIGFSSSYLPASRYAYKQILVLAFGTLITPWRTPSTTLMRWLSFMVVVFSTFVAGLVLLRQPSVEERGWRGLPLVFWPLASVAPVYTFFFVSPLLEGARYLYLAECAWAIIVARALTSAVARGTAYQRLAQGFGAIFVVTSVVLLYGELTVWRGAAALRDEVVFSGRDVLTAGRCHDAQFSAVPDSFNGAYVFRNGFRQALGLPNPARAVADNCVFEWDEGAFRSVASPK